MAKKIVNKVKKFLCEEDGMGVIEVVLIVLVIFTIYKGCK